MRDSRSRILKQPIIWVEHLLGHEEEPLPGHPSVVKALLPLELHPEAGFQQVGPRHGEDAAVRVLQDRVSSDLHLEAIRDVGLCADHSEDSLWSCDDE